MDGLAIQISDPHFGTEQPLVSEALALLVHQQAPQLLLLSGDITQRATTAQFAAARAYVDRLGVPALLAVPGNHDLPLFNLVLRFAAPYARHRRAFDAQLEPVFESPGLLAIGVDSTRRWRQQNGQVSARQIEDVARRLALAPPSQLRLVMLHHPVAVPSDHDVHNLLRGREAALQRWAAAGADLILGGHIHLPYWLPLHDGPRRLAKPVWAVQAGTAMSRRVRREAGPSVNLIRFDSAPPVAALQRSCGLERWDYNAARQCFEAVAAQALTFA